MPHSLSTQVNSLTFQVGPRSLAVDLLSVQEISECREITRLPFSPEHLLGVTNLRGSIIPVVCLLTLLGEQASPVKTPVLLILKLPMEDGQRLAACLVERVLGVDQLDTAHLCPLFEGGSHSCLTRSYTATLLLQIYKTKGVPSESN